MYVKCSCFKICSIFAAKSIFEALPPVLGLNFHFISFLSLPARDKRQAVTKLICDKVIGVSSKLVEICFHATQALLIQHVVFYNKQQCSTNDNL